MKRGVTLFQRDGGFDFQTPLSSAYFEQIQNKTEFIPLFV
jgi:hypothetical protein